MTLAVAERDRAVPDLLDRLVALAGDDDDVARIGRAKGGRDARAVGRVRRRAARRSVATGPDLAR